MTTATQGGVRLKLPDKPLPKPTTPEEWAAVYQYLSQPLPPEWVSFRADSKPRKGRDGKSEFVWVVSYIDRNAVILLLNAVCGVGNWSFRFKALSLDPKGEVLTGQGRLQLWDTAVHKDVGSASNMDPSKGCLSDTLKRVATQVGIALYLGNMPGALFCDIERWGHDANDWKLSEAGLSRLYARLAGWDGRPDTWDKARPAASNMPQPATHDEDSSHVQDEEDAAPNFLPPTSTPTPAARPAAPSPATRAASPAQATPAAQDSGQEGGSRIGQPGYIQAQQLQAIRKLSAAIGTPEPENVEAMTYEDAKATITRLSGEYQQKRRAS